MTDTLEAIRALYWVTEPLEEYAKRMAARSGSGLGRQAAEAIKEYGHRQHEVAHAQLQSENDWQHHKYCGPDKGMIDKRTGESVTDNLEAIRRRVGFQRNIKKLGTQCEIDRRELLRLLDEATSDLKNAAPYRANWSKTEKAFRKRIAELEAAIVMPTGECLLCHEWECHNQDCVLYKSE